MMSKQEIISQVNSLIRDTKMQIESDPFDSEVFRKDKEALETVLKSYILKENLKS